MTGVGGITNAQLLKMSFQELDDLFGRSPAGPIPNGQADGRAIIAPGTQFSDEIAAIINIFGWKGKEFDAEHGTLTNRILPLGLNAIVAQVYTEASWFDQNECIVLDYSKTSAVAHWIRDEIRLVDVGTYLGIVYWDDHRILNFALEFPTS